MCISHYSAVKVPSEAKMPLCCVGCVRFRRSCIHIQSLENSLAALPKDHFISRTFPALKSLYAALAALASCGHVLTYAPLSARLPPCLKRFFLLEISPHYTELPRSCDLESWIPDVARTKTRVKSAFQTRMSPSRWFLSFESNLNR